MGSRKNKKDKALSDVSIMYVAEVSKIGLDSQTNQ